MYLFAVIFFILWTGTAVSQEGFPTESGIPDEIWIKVDISDQKLSLLLGDSLIQHFPVSTSRYGIGNEANSNKTPLGWHRICEKIGANEPPGMIFESRRPTGQIARIITDSTDIEADVITTRILRLKGCETDVNRGGNIDSFERCIYIHGTPEEGLIGQPSSHGCIRMKNRDIITLFEYISRNTYLEIVQ